MKTNGFPPGLLTGSQAAVILGITRQRVNQLARQGRLKVAGRAGGHNNFWFDQAVVTAWGASPDRDRRLKQGGRRGKGVGGWKVSRKKVESA